MCATSRLCPSARLQAGPLQARATPSLTDRARAYCRHTTAFVYKLQGKKITLYQIAILDYNNLTARTGLNHPANIHALPDKLKRNGSLRYPPSYTDLAVPHQPELSTPLLSLSLPLSFSLYIYLTLSLCHPLFLQIGRAHV